MVVELSTWASECLEVLIFNDLVQRLCNFCSFKSWCALLLRVLWVKVTAPLCPPIPIIMLKKRKISLVSIVCLHCRYQWTFWSLMVIEINNSAPWIQPNGRRNYHSSNLHFVSCSYHREDISQTPILQVVTVEILIINLFVRRVHTIRNFTLVAGWHYVTGQILCNDIGNGSDRRKMHQLHWSWELDST
jgi:hypothetical protein